MTQYTPEIISWAQAGQRTWVTPASLTLSAAKLESNLGAQIPKGTNNWFGIKDPRGPKAPTGEQTAGGVWYTIEAGWHVFKTPADGFMYYAWLLANYEPYHQAMQMFRASRRAAADVQDLTRSIGHIYATALAYGNDLILIQKQDKLYQYDTLPSAAVPAQPKEKPMSTSTSTTPAPGPTPTPAPAPVPTVAAPVTVDWGDLINQILTNAEPIIAATAQTGVSTALASIPFGSFISDFIGPTVIGQYVTMGINAVEGQLKGQAISVPAGSVEAIIANLFNQNEPALAAFLGADVEPLIAAAIAKIKL